MRRDFYRDQSAQAQRWALERWAEFYNLSVSIHATSPEMESPLERAFAVWFMACCSVFGDHLNLLAQHEVRTESGRLYRLDFLVTASTDLGHFLQTNVAVELDGHAFHEKTLEQVTARNARDRDLQQLGYRVFHFSFSEFAKAPERCAREVHEAGLAWFGEWQMRTPAVPVETEAR